MVGIRSFLFGMAQFQGRTVSFGEGVGCFAVDWKETAPVEMDKKRGEGCNIYHYHSNWFSPEILWNRI